MEYRLTVHRCQRADHPGCNAIEASATIERMEARVDRSSVSLANLANCATVQSEKFDFAAGAKPYRASMVVEYGSAPDPPKLPGTILGYPYREVDFMPPMPAGVSPITVGRYGGVKIPLKVKVWKPPKHWKYRDNRLTYEGFMEWIEWLAEDCPTGGFKTYCVGGYSYANPEAFKRFARQERDDDDS